MKASKLKNLKRKIKTWKVWRSKSMFGFTHHNDIYLWKLATNLEPTPDAIIYGLNLEDALKRYVSKHPWTASSMRYSQVDNKTFAKFVALPNHGMHLKACPWSWNIQKQMQFWM